MAVEKTAEIFDFDFISMKKKLKDHRITSQGMEDYTKQAGKKIHRTTISKILNGHTRLFAQSTCEWVKEVGEIILKQKNAIRNEAFERFKQLHLKTN